MTTRGIFILENVRTRQREGQWVPVDDVYGRDSLQDKGYVVGGKNSSNNSVSNYQAITYSNDTLANIANLPYVRRGPYGVSSPSIGYTIGGIAGPGEFNSNINKLTLSTQTHAVLPGASLSAAYGEGGSCGSSTAGYVCGGKAPAEPNGYTRLEKLTYSTETMERIPGSNMPSYPSGVYNNSASGDGDTAGYWVGGATQGGSRVNKLTYSNDSWGNVPNLPGSPNLNRSQKAGQASSDTGFYLVGGSNPYSSRVQKVTFASGTNSIVTNSTVPTSNGRMQLTGTGSPSSGYFAGGTQTSIVERLNFSTNSMSRLPALDLSTGLSDLGSLSSVADNKKLPDITQTFTGKVASFDFGYATGGEQASPYPGSGNTRTFKVKYSTDTSARIPSADQNIATRYQFAAGTSSTGYIAGGLSGSVPGDGSESMDKFHYSTDTRAFSPNWGNRRAASFAMTNEGRTHFYGLGGYGQPSSNPKQNGYKMDYATESPSTLPSNANLSISRRAGAPYVTKSNEGYMAGGGAWPSDQRSNVDKIQFGSDTTSRIPGANLPNSVSNNHGTSESSAGYSFGGVRSGTFYSYLYKTTFATDTSANNPASLPALNSKITTMGNPTDAYLAGGWASNPGPGYHMSTLYKYTYSTETFSQLPNLASFMVSGAGMSAGDDNMPFQTPPVSTPTPTKSPGPAFNGALWMGGYTPSNSVISSGGKISFDDDTVTALPSTNLTANRYNLSATSSSLAGYYGQAQTTQIVKVDYTTNSPSTLSDHISGGPGGPGNDPRRRGTSFGLKTAGYFMQGSTGSSGNLSNLDKITYSTEVIARLPGSNAQHGAYATVGTSNQTAGYQTGGTPGGQNMYKLPFATESWSSVPSLGVEMWDANSFANTTHGYFMGGSGNGTGSRTYKLTFSTDSSSRLPSSNVPQNIRYGWGSGNSSYGYMSGQQKLSPSNSGTSIIYKLNYSNDSWSTAANNADPAARQNAGAGARQSGNGDKADNIVPNNF